jgi:hypothetical protein
MAARLVQEVQEVSAGGPEEVAPGEVVAGASALMTTTRAPTISLGLAPMEIPRRVTQPNWARRVRPAFAMTRPNASIVWRVRMRPASTDAMALHAPGRVNAKVVFANKRHVAMPFAMGRVARVIKLARRERA